MNALNKISPQVSLNLLFIKYNYYKWQSGIATNVFMALHPYTPIELLDKSKTIIDLYLGIIFIAHYGWIQLSDNIKTLKKSY